MYEQFAKKCKDKQLEYNELSKQLFLVKLSMAAPFSAVDHIRLDGLLAYQSLRHILGSDFYNLDPNKTTIEAPLPLEKCENDSEQWWWACSFGAYHLDYKALSTWKKRWDDQHDSLVKFPEKRKPRIDHKAGFFKAYSMPLVVRGAKEIVFCGYGNIIEVKKILTGVTHIGKKRSQGYGRVSKIEVKETSDKWYCWTEDKQATRAIPISKTKIRELSQGSIVAVNMAYRPPYWKRDNYAMCYQIAEKITR